MAHAIANVARRARGAGHRSHLPVTGNPAERDGVDHFKHSLGKGRSKIEPTKEVVRLLGCRVTHGSLVDSWLHFWHSSLS